MADLAIVTTPEQAARLFLDRGCKLAEFAAVQGLDLSTAGRMLAQPEVAANLQRLIDTGEAASTVATRREIGELLTKGIRDKSKTIEERLVFARALMDFHRHAPAVVKRKRRESRASALGQIRGEIIDVGGAQ